MSYFQDKQILVIFGGRNDDLFEESGKTCFNDIWILIVEKMEWTQLDIKENISTPAPRYSHSAACIGKSLVIFGGLSDENYCTTQAFSIEIPLFLQRKKNEYKIFDKRPKETIASFSRLRFNSKDLKGQTSRLLKSSSVLRGLSYGLIPKK